jgi:hypothetical protein
MTFGAITLAVMLAATPAAQQLDEAAMPEIDLRAAAAQAAEAVVAEDVEQFEGTGAVPEDERGYFELMYRGAYSPPELTFIAASVVDMWSKSELRKECEANPYIQCDPTWPESVQADVLMTAGVYAGVVGLERLAKKYWDVELDEGWKNLLIFGGMAGVRSVQAYLQMRDANDIRGFGR